MTVLDSAESGRRLRCALFVDFDNVNIGLQRLDLSAAEALANASTHWLTALETGNEVEGELSRRFLIRACYLVLDAVAALSAKTQYAGGV